MAKTLVLSTDFLGEEYTLKCALKSYIKTEEEIIKQLKKQYGKEFIPNMHLHKAAIANSKAILKRL